MKDIPFAGSLKTRLILVLSIMFILAAIHAVRIGSYLNGDLYIYYYSFASDLMIPFGAYFLLSLNEIQIRFLQKWYVKVIIVFSVMTFSEIMQHFGFYFFGDTFDWIDILMFATGAFIAALVDKQIFERFVPLWKY